MMRPQILFDFLKHYIYKYIYRYIYIIIICTNLPSLLLHLFLIIILRHGSSSPTTNKIGAYAVSQILKLGLN